MSDRDGEWIELFNRSEARINLRGWILADGKTDRHEIDTDLWIEPRAYLVLARNTSAGANGGVLSAYMYDGIALGNLEDRIYLFTPDGFLIDQVEWGGESPIHVTAGASLERTDWDSDTSWQTATLPWPGSAGDFGSPGAAYVLHPTPTPTPTATATPTVTPLPTLPSLWPPVATPAPIQIEEVQFRGSGSEYIALINVSTVPVDLTGWNIGDAQIPGTGEGIYSLPPRTLLPNELFIVARNGADFESRWGQQPDAQIEGSASPAPILPPRRDLASGTLALNDSGDEVVLIDPSGMLADAVAFGQGDTMSLGMTGSLLPVADFSLQRVPGNAYPEIRDQRRRFLWAPANPFVNLQLPTPGPHGQGSIEGGLMPVWGSLGVYSNFTPGYTAPPRYLQAAAAATGLDFLAIAAPPDAWPLVSSDSSVVTLPAWEWSSNEGAHAIVYGAPPADVSSEADLATWLEANHGLAQWLSSPPDSLSPIIALAADPSHIPADLPLLFHSWNALGLPAIPAGNTAPPLPGMTDPTPAFTGLAVSVTDEPGIMEALAARRGWLTNAPGVWLTLRATGQDTDDAWMGSVIQPANLVTLDIAYGDPYEQPAGLSLWRNDAIVAQLDVPPTDGRWSLQVPAIPGTFMFAVATQADGDFAVTAPLYVQDKGRGHVVINEVLPAPGTDWNKDGEINSYDEYIELYNAGPDPVSLAGWQVTDQQPSALLGAASTANRFTFGNDRYLGAGQHLLLWRTESRISLNNAADTVTLVDDAGQVVDSTAWQQGLGTDNAWGRVPDGGTWYVTLPTPDERNRPRVVTVPSPGPGQTAPSATAATGNSSRDPGLGQAWGPPGSVAAAKRAGLKQQVTVEGVVTVPPGLFNASMYIANPVPTAESFAWLGIQVYLLHGDFPDLREGDRVRVQGYLNSFRGEQEILLTHPNQVVRLGPGVPLLPLAIGIAEIGESLEGRLVTFQGKVTGWQGNRISLADLLNPQAEPVEVTVRSSLDWRRPYVQLGQVWQVTGVVSQFAREAPWEGGYRVLVRYPSDLQLRVDTE